MNAQPTPAQAGLKNRKLTQWQDNFSRFIYQETGYIPDQQTLKLTLLLQKQYRASPWNKARLGKADGALPELPELPLVVDEIKVHIPEKLPVLTNGRETEEQPLPSVADWGRIKAEAGPAWKFRTPEPFTTTFTPEPQPDPAAMQKLESKIDAARKKAGRRKVV